MKAIANTIPEYNALQDPTDKEICDVLQKEFDKGLPNSESKIWHGHPVWFLDGNPIVGYSKQKAGLRVMFWSGADFKGPGLQAGTGKYKDASIFYTDVAGIDVDQLRRWLEESQHIQWDYKNIVKRKGVLERLK